MPFSPKLALFRARTGLTQNDLARRLGVSQAQISRYENNPDSITVGMYFEWLAACGITNETAELLSREGEIESPRNFGAPYKELWKRLSFLEQYLLESNVVSVDSKSEKKSDPFTLQHFKQKISDWRQKPHLLLVGRFDAGKSRLANALLGGDHLPSDWTPTTNVVTFVRHDEDRPSWRTDRDEVWIMDEDFDPADFADDKKCNHHKIAAGSMEILWRFGTKKSAKEARIAPPSIPEVRKAGYALVYLDSPILRACTIVDLPGFEYAQGYKPIQKSVQRGADLLLFACPAAGFLDSPDHSYLGMCLRVMLPDSENNASKMRLRRLLIVATHASKLSFDDEKIEHILDEGSERLYDTLRTLLELKTESVVQPDDLKSRMFTFWAEEPSRRVALEKELTVLLGRDLPPLVANRVDTELSQLREQSTNHFSTQIEMYQRVAKELDSAPDRKKEVEEERENFEGRLKANEQRVITKVNHCRDSTRKFIEQNIAPLVTKDQIEDFIRDRFGDKRKEAKKYALVGLLETIQTKVEIEVNKHSAEFRAVVDNFVNDLSPSHVHPDVAISASKLSIPFDFKGTIAASLASLSIGAVGNVVFAFKIGTAAAFVSAIGGPVTVVVALSTLAALSTWALVSSSWQQRLASKLNAELKKQNLVDQLISGSEKYWNDTQSNFYKTVEIIAGKFSDYVNSLTKLMDSQDVKEIEKIIGNLANLKKFFEDIPWKSQVAPCIDDKSSVEV
jgi:transcriptional regulator with XRE-family HTH domain